MHVLNSVFLYLCFLQRTHYRTHVVWVSVKATGDWISLFRHRQRTKAILLARECTQHAITRENTQRLIPNMFCSVTCHSLNKCDLILRVYLNMLYAFLSFFFFLPLYEMVFSEIQNKIIYSEDSLTMSTIENIRVNDYSP